MKKEEVQLLITADKTINTLLDILAAQDARLRHLEIKVDAKPVAVPKATPIEKLESAVRSFRKDMKIENLSGILRDLTSYVTWNDSRLMRLERRITTRGVSHATS